MGWWYSYFNLKLWSKLLKNTSFYEKNLLGELAVLKDFSYSEIYETYYKNPFSGVSFHKLRHNRNRAVCTV